MKKTLLILCAFFLLSCDGSENQKDSSPDDLVTTSLSLAYSHTKMNPTEQSLIDRLLPRNEQGALRSLVLLKNDDRVAAVWWEERATAKKEFGTLKEKIFPLLSSRAENIVDSTLKVQGHIPVIIFAFTDPALHSERILFARIGDTLYEFHGNDEEEILGLLAALSNESSIRAAVSP